MPPCRPLVELVATRTPPKVLLFHLFAFPYFNVPTQTGLIALGGVLKISQQKKHLENAEFLVFAVRG